MITEISVACAPGGGSSARDLGYLLVKHPDKEHGGEGWTLRFPIARDELTTARIDVPHSRGVTRTGLRTLTRALHTAIFGELKNVPCDPDAKLQVTLSAWGVRAQLRRVERFFAPLGWTAVGHEITVPGGAIDTAVLASLRLSHEGIPVRQALRQFYLFLTALSPEDGEANEDQVKKLLRLADELQHHPDRDLLIKLLGAGHAASRALRDGLQDLDEDEATDEGSAEDTLAPDAVDVEAAPDATEVEHEPRVGELRRARIVEALHDCVGRPVVDVGCGDGRLVQALHADGHRPLFAVEPSIKELTIARRWLCRREYRDDVLVLQGALCFEDLGLTEHVASQIRGGCFVLSEVIEHLDRARLEVAFASLLQLRPRRLVITTPNARYNAAWNLPGMRHEDHRWEWDEETFRVWCEHWLCDYNLAFFGVGDPEGRADDLGHVSQGVVATLKRDEPSDSRLAGLIGTRLCRVPWARGFPVVHRQRQPPSAALAGMARFGPHMAKLPWLPPTMAPGGTSVREDHLEHVEDAVAYYRERGVTQLVAQRKWMGSNAIAWVERDPDPVGDGGFVCTRLGRDFYPGRPEQARRILAGLRRSLALSGFWDLEQVDGALVNAEIMPWSNKGRWLVREQFAQPLAMACAEAYARGEACRNEQLALDALSWFVEPEKALDYAAPFAVVALQRTDGTRESCLERDAVWHGDRFGLVEGDGGTARILPTPHLVLPEQETRLDATFAHWTGPEVRGEGVVVKPRHWRPGVLPAVKARGRHYLRIIYGPDYLEPERLARWKRRDLKRKRALAHAQTATGLEALQAWIQRDVSTHTKALFELLTAAYGRGSRLDPRL